MPRSAGELTATQLSRLTAAPVGRLATVTPNGQPHVVPIVFALSSGRIYTAVDHKPKATSRLQRLINISAEPRVSLLVDHYEEEWSRLWWIRIDGTATVHQPGSSVHTIGTAALTHVYPDHYTGIRLGAVICIEPTAVRQWGDFTD